MLFLIEWCRPKSIVSIAKMPQSSINWTWLICRAKTIFLFRSTWRRPKVNCRLSWSIKQPLHHLTRATRMNHMINSSVLPLNVNLLTFLYKFFCNFIYSFACRFASLLRNEFRWRIFANSFTQIRDQCASEHKWFEWYQSRREHSVLLSRWTAVDNTTSLWRRIFGRRKCALVWWTKCSEIMANSSSSLFVFHKSCTCRRIKQNKSQVNQWQESRNIAEKMASDLFISISSQKHRIDHCIFTRI